MYMYTNHFAVQQKLTQHCKSTILQYKGQIVKYSWPLRVVQSWGKKGLKDFFKS